MHQKPCIACPDPFGGAESWIWEGDPRDREGHKGKEKGRDSIPALFLTCRHVYK